MSLSTAIRGRIGVNAVERAVLEIGWLFRELPTSDFGIDGQIEIVDDSGNPTGRLIAVQIKSGPSYLKEKTSAGFIFRGEPRHLSYWGQYSLPVIVVLHDPESGTCYWRSVESGNVKTLKRGWKMTIPLDQRLAEEAGPALQRLSTGSPYFLRLAELAQARPLMQRVVDGSRLFLEAEEWINKSSGRGSLYVKAQAEDGSEETLVEWPFVMFPGWDYVDVFPHLFPWAATRSTRTLMRATTRHSGTRNVASGTARMAAT